MRGVLLKILHETWLGTLLFTLALFLVEVVLNLVLPEFFDQMDDILARLPFIRDFISAMLGVDIEGEVTAQLMQAFVWVHPTVLQAALTAGEIEQRGLLDRLIGFQANTSARSPEELVHLEELETEAPTTFAASMLQIHQRFAIPILGGCCGTDTRHIERLAGLYSFNA